MKLAILVLLVGTAASSSVLVSSQRNIVPHYSKYGYGDGLSARFFDKAETGLGLYRPLKVVYDGYDGLGLEYAKLGLGYNGIGLGYDRLGYGKLAYGYDRLPYGTVGYGLGYGVL